MCYITWNLLKKPSQTANILVLTSKYFNIEVLSTVAAARERVAQTWKQIHGRMCHKLGSYISWTTEREFSKSVETWASSRQRTS